MMISGENIVFEIDKLLEKKDLTRADACRYAKINLRAMTDWAKKGTIPAADTLYSIANFLQTTVECLLTGKDKSGFSQEIISIAQKIAGLAPGDRQDILDFINIKLKKHKREAKTVETAIVKEPTPDYSTKTIDISRYTDDEIPMDSVKFMGWDMVFLPYLGKTAAGEPIEINTYTGQGMPFPLPKLKGKAEDYFVVLIDGTSMTEAGIHTGDYVVIRKAEEPKNGKIMLVRYENSSTLKRIKVEKKKGGKETVYLYWEDGSGDFKVIDDSEYEIQGEFYHNLGK
jgi:SOS-response transcriptional repressor LexA